MQERHTSRRTTDGPVDFAFHRNHAHDLRSAALADRVRQARAAVRAAFGARLHLTRTH